MPRMLSLAAALLALATAARADTITSVPPPPPAAPVAVVTMDPALQAWQARTGVTLPPGQTLAIARISIPAGYTLVIENVSGQVTSQWTNQLSLTINTRLHTGDTATMGHVIPVPRATASDGQNSFFAAFSQPTRIYTRLDSDFTDFWITVFRYGPADQSASLYVALSGRLVPNP